MSDLALSTMWGIGRFPTVKEFILQASRLGFRAFELNHGVDSKMLDGLERNGYPIPSIHEPCPADISVATLRQRNWLVSATDEEERRKGVEAIQRSIDLAQMLEAQVVIVHPGRVDMDTAPEGKLVQLFRAGKTAIGEYAALKEELVSGRASRAKTNMAAVRRSIVELAEYASARGIRLGLENRYHFFEIPLPDELEELLSLDQGGTVGYWYDDGHAQALDRLGLRPHEEWLRRFSSRIVGAHLHDVIGVDDHRPAGSGEVDWEMVRRYLPKEGLRTCEFQNNNSPEAVVAGAAWLKEKGIVP